jgi:hypothetical protein
MKLPWLIFVVVLFLAGKQAGFSQNFVNLNFESADIPKGTSPGPIPISEGLPGWSQYIISSSATEQLTQVEYDGISLAGAGISIADTNIGFGFGPIQGKYSVFLFGGLSLESRSNSAQISQTGLVPVGTESIQLDAELFAGPSFIVTLGGQTINMSPLQGFSGGDVLYGGNIPSSLAGEVATLSITEPPPSNNPPSILELDDIVFSSNPVPEPGTLGLSVLGGLFLTWRRWKK